MLVFHGAPDATVNAGVAAIEALGAANDFEVDTSQSAADFTAANLDQYRAVVFLDNDGDPLNAAQETALQAYIQGGGGFVGIGGAAEAEPGSTFFNGLIGARPAAGSPTATAEQVVAVGDRVHPANEGLPLEWTRSDVWYQWTPGPRARSTPSPATARRTRPPATAPPPAAPTGRSPGAATSRAAAPSTPAWAAPRRAYGEASFRTHLLGAIQWSAGMIRAGCKATIAANYAGTRLVDGSTRQPRAHRRVARRRARAQRLGRSTSAAPTAAPTRSAAR